jgi:hypothetical protein
MKNLTKLFFFTAISVLFFAGDFDEATQFGFRIIQDAEAVIGRPLTPVSVAGVRRRTRRRTAAVIAVSQPVVIAPVVVAPIVPVVRPVIVPVRPIVRPIYRPVYR